MPSPDIAEIRRDFDLEGFAHLKGVFSQARVEGLVHALDRFVEEKLDAVSDKAINRGRDGGLIQVKGLDKYDAGFEALLHDPELMALASGLLGAPVAPAWVHYRNAPCRSGDEVYPHQDSQGLNLHPCHAVTFWMPLGPCGPESGCLRYVPGSHWAGFQDLAYAAATVEHIRDREVALTADGGDVLAHHCMTIHRSAPNATGRRRPALMFFYKSAAAQAIDPGTWTARYGARRMAG